jgi:cation transporter-like permease
MLTARMSSSSLHGSIQTDRCAHTLANKLLGGAVYAIPLLAGLGNHTLLISIIRFHVFFCSEEITAFSLKTTGTRCSRSVFR